MPIHVTPTPIDVGPALPPPLNGFDLVLEEQQTNNWCWAACVEMVLKRLTPVPAENRQCQIARKGLRLADPPIKINESVGCCSGGGSNPLCDKRLEDATITKLWESYDLKVDPSDDDFADDVDGTVARLVGMLNRRNPVELGFSDNDGHVVMLSRWEFDEDGRRMFIYHNPGPGSGSTVTIPAVNLVAFGSKVLDATWEIRVSE
jgi:hypothetical protein